MYIHTLQISPAYGCGSAISILQPVFLQDHFLCSSTARPVISTRHYGKRGLVLTMLKFSLQQLWGKKLFTALNMKDISTEQSFVVNA